MLANALAVRNSSEVTRLLANAAAVLRTGILVLETFKFNGNIRGNY